MLNATRAVLTLKQSSQNASWSLLRAHLSVIERLGTPEDAEALLDCFLEAPASHWDLLDAITRAGGVAQARRMLSRCVDAEGLLPEVPPEVLTCFGYHGLAETRSLLWGYAIEDPALRHENTHSENSGAVAGLLHLDCQGLEEEIEARIRELLGRPFFPEFLPALAYKTGKEELVELLWEIGQAASTDCNGGTILGIALFGAAGRARFEELMWAPGWAANDTGTGSVHAVYQGMSIQRLSILEVYESWKRRLAAGEHPLHGVVLLENLLKARLSNSHTGLRFAPHPVDTFQDLHAQLFDRPREQGSDAFVALARKHLEVHQVRFREDFVRDLECLEARIADRMQQELLLTEHAFRQSGA